MPYQKSPYFDTPEDKAELWRYMPIDKFMAMLNDGALYFPKITSFKDNYEGKLPFLSRQNVQKENLFNENNTPIKRDDAFFKHKKVFEDTYKKLADDMYEESGIVIHHRHSFETLLEDFSNHLMFCSSWFLKSIESHSMWTEYGEKIPTSIAIQTTVGDLLNSLYFDDNEFHIHIGRIKYIDYKTGYIEAYKDFSKEDLTDHNTVLKLFYAPVMHKRNIFEDEHEVRAIISFESICKNYTNRMYTSEIPFYSDRLFKGRAMTLDDDITDFADMTNDMKDIPPQGIRVGVNINKLIQKIIMSPNINEYFYPPLIKLVQYYGLDRNIVYFSDI